MAHPQPDPSDRRAEPRPTPDRRRQSWSEFRRAYPGIVATMGIALLFMLGLDMWLVYKRVKYGSEISRLRSGMTDVERRRTDLALGDQQNRLRVMIELIRRQAQGDKDLHLSVAVDSGTMYLEREGATLREMPVDVAPERWVGTPPDTVMIAAPRGARTVERVLGPKDPWVVPRWVYRERGLPAPAESTVVGALGPAAIVLNGGTVIYSLPSSGPLADSLYVLPGAVRARASDVKAIAPNLKAGMTIYFY
jgi:hypothetical protein